MTNISLGLLLMLVGMVTVFAILLIVIYGSQLLIGIVNRVVPPEEPVSKASAEVDVDPVTVRVITAAVERITGGKGHITNISRV